MNMCSCAKQFNSTVTDVKEKPVTEEKIQEVPDVQVDANKAPAQSAEMPANSLNQNGRSDYDGNHGK